MRMNKFNNPKAIASFTIFGLLVSWMGYILFQKIQLNNNHKITIGITIGGRATPKGFTVDYYYYVKGVKYESSRHPDNSNLNPIRNGGRYFVEFLPSDPEVNEVLWGEEVPLKIKNAPSEGWKEIPSYFP